jgi:selenocysteine lyase/cysteine desulfurase
MVQTPAFSANCDVDSRLDELRSTEFNEAADLAYLDHASDSPMPARAARVVAERTVLLQVPSLPFRPRELYLAEARDRLGHLLNADGSRFAFLTNISDATATIANGLSWNAGDEVVILAGEFASFVFPWRNLQRLGVRTEVVGRESVATDLDRVEAAINRRTRVVAISDVDYHSGFRNDLASISRLAHEAGALFVVDASQSLGALSLDAISMGIDALIAVGYKWLMSPHGISVLYVSEQAQAEISPTMPGRYSVEGGWETDDYALEWLPTAQRYQGGALNWIGVCALAESLGLLVDVGPEQIERVVLAGTQSLIDRLDELPVIVTTDRRAARRSSIVTFTLGSEEADEAVVRAARETNVLVGRRKFGVRAGYHFWNNSRDIDRLLEIVETTCRTYHISSS